MRKLFYLFFFLMAGQALYAQQLPLYSQYLYNKYLINPAIAGSDGFTSFNITAREQWIGYSGAPRTYSLSYQTRFLKRGYRLKDGLFRENVYRPKTEGKIGMGGYIFSDRNGLIHRTGFMISYSYHMWIEDYTQLSFGLDFTGYHFKIAADETSFEDPDEPWLNDNMRRGVFIPDSDFGIYILNPRYSVGFSGQQLFGAVAKIGSPAYKNYWMDRHYYLFGSYNFYSGVKAEIQPSLLLKVSEQFRPQVDVGLTYIYDMKLWAGISYRTGSALIANIGMKYVNSRVKLRSMYFGYSFDYALNQIHRATYGTHELTVAVRFGDSAKRFRWLDRF